MQTSPAFHPDPLPPGARGEQAPSTGQTRQAGARRARLEPSLPSGFARSGLPAPEYSLEARRRGQQGVVRIQLQILPNGQVGQISVVSEPGYPLLRAAALAAEQRLRGYRFTPAYADGKPVAASIIIPYVFALR
jgi:periplasmic protein TonB